MITSIVDKYIRSKVITIRPKDKPWMNGLIRQNIRKRDRLLKRFSYKKDAFNWERYRRQRNVVVTLIRKAKKDYNDKINSSLR